MATTPSVPLIAVQLDPHPENDGRWGVVTGRVTPGTPLVSVLVFSHDERWYHQKPVAPKADGTFSARVAFGLDPISDRGREYIVVAYVGPGLPKQAVYSDLNQLPPAYAASAPISVVRTDA